MPPAGRLAVAIAIGKSGTDILRNGALILLNAGDKGDPALKLGLGLPPLVAVWPSLEEA